MSAADESSDNLPWHLGVFDAHCHPTDTLESLELIPGMRANVLTVMATRAQDQQLVANAADRLGVTSTDVADRSTNWSHIHKIVPAFGWHPWFSHQMFDEQDYDGMPNLTDDQKVAHYQSVLTPKPENREYIMTLPDPRPFGDFVQQTKSYLEKYPMALIGEVGLDKSFRIPETWLPEHRDDRNDSLTPGGREGRQLSPYRVSMDHQRKVVLRQLRLAGEMQRAVSMHGVAAHGVVYDTLTETWKGHELHVPSKKERKAAEAAAKAHAGPQEVDEQPARTSGPMPYPPRVCLHSFSGPEETVRQYLAPSIPCDIFFSFSTTINSWSETGDGKVEAAVRAVPNDKILIESDLHTAGDKMDGYLEEIARKICEVKHWNLEAGVKQLGQNWRRFVFGIE